MKKRGKDLKETLKDHSTGIIPNNMEFFVVCSHHLDFFHHKDIPHHNINPSPTTNFKKLTITFYQA